MKGNWMDWGILRQNAQVATVYDSCKFVLLLDYGPSKTRIISPMIIKMGHITTKKFPFLGVFPGMLKCQDC